MAKFIFEQLRNYRPINQGQVRKADKRVDIGTYGTQNLAAIWGKVIDIRDYCYVDVLLVNGIKLQSVPVASQGFVKKGTKNEPNRATGSKNIPQVGSKVLIIFPDGIVENALVLCSGFDVLQDWQTSELIKQGEESIEIDISDFGWKKSEDKDTGKYAFESPDGNNKVTIIYDLANTSITIEQKIDASHTNKITMNSSGVKVEDKNGNVIECGTTSVKVNNNLEVLQ